jgi:hypothetical protein
LDDELEHGWAGGLDIEIGNERPSTGLATDPGVRRWILGGVGASCLLTAVFVMLASHDEPSTNAAAEVIPDPSRELEPAPSEVSPAPSAPVKLVAPSSSPRPAKADSTLAAGSSAAVQAKPRAPVPPQPVAAPKKTPVKPTPAAAPKPAPTAPPEPPKLPSEASPTTSNDELPDVEAWDEADDDAAILTPS